MPIDPDFPKNHQVIGKHKHAEVGAAKTKIEPKKRGKTCTEVQTQKCIEYLQQKSRPGELLSSSEVWELFF